MEKDLITNPKSKNLFIIMVKRYAELAERELLEIKDKKPLW